MLRLRPPPRLLKLKLLKSELASPRLRPLLTKLLPVKPTLVKTSICFRHQKAVRDVPNSLNRHRLMVVAVQLLLAVCVTGLVVVRAIGTLLENLPLLLHRHIMVATSALRHVMVAMRALRTGRHGMRTLREFTLTAIAIQKVSTIERLLVVMVFHRPLTPLWLAACLAILCYPAPLWTGCIR